MCKCRCRRPHPNSNSFPKLSHLPSHACSLTCIPIPAVNARKEYAARVRHKLKPKAKPVDVSAGLLCVCVCVYVCVCACRRIHRPAVYVYVYVCVCLSTYLQARMPVPLPVYLPPSIFVFPQVLSHVRKRPSHPDGHACYNVGDQRRSQRLKWRKSCKKQSFPGSISRCS